MKRIWFGSRDILTAGYDAQCAILEIEFATKGRILQYLNVSEELWYCFKREETPELFFHRFIKGNYSEKEISDYKFNF